MKELVSKYVKVYGDCKTKSNYEGDGRIEKVIKQISDDIYLCDVSFDDCYYSVLIDKNDIF